jgi:hypothetical protein
MNRVVFNGREYSSVEEMPPDVRRVYEDAMASVGALDKAGGSGGSHITITTRLVVNGKEYSSIHEMPPLIRAAFEKLAHRRETGQSSEGPTETPRAPLAIEDSSSLDAQLRLSPTTRFLVALVVVGTLATFLLWR